MFEIAERTKVKVKLYGKEAELFVPSVGALEKVQRSLKETPNEALDVFTEFLGKLGMPKELMDELEISHIEQLITYLATVKKN